MVSGPAWLQAVTAAAVTFAVFMVIVLLRRRGQGGPPAPPSVGQLSVTPYSLHQTVLTAVEQRFYYRVVEALGSDYYVCPKIRLADVIDVRGDAMEYNAAWNRIAAKRIDFLITNDLFRPVLAIDLMGDSHFGGQQKGPDPWLERALGACGLPVLKVPARRDYDAGVLRRQIEEQLAKK